MRNIRWSISILLLVQLSPALAADANVRVIVSGEVKPGAYGRVEIGGAPPPPVVYREPIVVVQPPRTVQVQPIYLHVPPGHAKHWSKHCREYNACGAPVYFVASDEYKVKKDKKEKKEKKEK